MKLLAALEEKGTYEGAAKKLRITSQTIRNWRADDPTLDAECEDARSLGRKTKADTVLETLFTVATDKKHPGMVTAAIFLMKSLEPETFTDRVKNEHSGAITFADLAGIATADAESSSNDPRSVK